MAKINARGAHQIGPTLITERTRPEVVGDCARVYREAFRLRSDGMVQTRIVSTRPAPGEEGHETKHSSGYSNLGKLSDPNIDRLRAWLTRKGYEVVKEQRR